MASDGIPVKPLATQLVQGSKPPTAATVQASGGKSLPAGGTKAASEPVHSPPPAKPVQDLQALVVQLNKHVQNSGRPSQFRLASSAGGKVIQEFNPDTDQVVSELPVSQFKALAVELGISGLLVDAHA